MTAPGPEGAPDGETTTEELLAFGELIAGAQVAIMVDHLGAVRVVKCPHVNVTQAVQLGQAAVNQLRNQVARQQ